MLLIVVVIIVLFFFLCDFVTDHGPGCARRDVPAARLSQTEKNE
jgi:hypothetical protein